jgi:hypothetical protein
MEDGMSKTNHSDEFVPKGALAFFLLLILLYGVMWFSLYFQLMGRM